MQRRRSHLLLLLLLILLQLLPSLCIEFIIDHKIKDLGNFTVNGTTFVFNFSAPRICVYTENARQPRRLEYSASMSGSINEFCGKWQQVGLGVVVLMIMVPVVGLALYVHARKDDEEQLLGETLRRLPGTPREFRYADLYRATGGFCPDNLLGRGGFGEVFHGVLPDSVQEIAVKRFLRETGRGDFLSELTIINRLSHRNLVRLLGWCYKNRKLLLVYTFMPNGSLDWHLYGNSGSETLTWDRRYNILAGLASALQYLHNGCEQKVLHRDITSSNIMLDAAFNACLGDFGLARATSDDNASATEEDGVPGKLGYLAPEYLDTGKASGKTDVFSFGAVVLEVVCGRRPGSKANEFPQLLDWVWDCHKKDRLLETVDERLKNNYRRDDAERLLLLGLACSHPRASQRPKAQAICHIIATSSLPPMVPPSMPEWEASFRITPVFTEKDLYSNYSMYSSLMNRLAVSGGDEAAPSSSSKSALAPSSSSKSVLEIV